MTFATHPNQKRSACERCRRQKLRCSRQDDENETRCTRCAERGLDCIAGHQRRIGRPSRRWALNHAISMRQPEVSVSSTNTDDEQQPAVSGVHDDLPGDAPLDSSGSLAEFGHGITTDTTISLDYHLDDFPWDMSLDPHLDGSISAQMAEEEMERIASTSQIADPAIQNEAFVKISKINVDLHSYLSTLVAFQDFIGILSGMKKTDSIHQGVSPTARTLPVQPALAQSTSCSESGSLNPSLLVWSRASSPLASQTAVPITGVLNQALVLVITSCYVQMITVFEEIFIQIHKRLEAIAWDPIQPIEGIKFGAFPIGDAHLQGIIFSQIVESLLEKADRLLGVQHSMVSSAGTVISSGILSSSQSDLLHDQLKSKNQASIPRSIGLKSAIQRMRSTLTAAT
ncbi:uncharacterized protein N0V96_001017 [Colletotrichum fioriniae]|uniref:uncharacterized protein n=1 Tax=Colletotrichum fioriniae TaxID=710243 RepID=UPI0032DBB52A|nr:hypothetical protein N0V96_001017 [Colletotrichum fioriniae]